MATDANLIKGAQSVAQAKSQAVGPRAVGFAAGLAKGTQGLKGIADKQIEKKKEADKKLLEFADQRTTIDMSAVTDPEYRNTISEYLAAGKKKYNEGANQAVANSEDPFGEAYGAGKKIMQDVNDHTAVTVKQIAKFDQLRNQFQAQITENGGLPFGLSDEERNIAEAIFTGTADMKIDANTGKVSFLVKGKTIELDTYKFPTDEKPEVEKLETALTAKYLDSNKPMSEGQVDIMASGLKEQLGTRSAIVGTLADKMGPGPSEERTEEQKMFEEIYNKLDAANYSPEALKEAKEATAIQMAISAQTRVNKIHEDKLLYNESFNNLADGKIAQFEASSSNVRYTIKSTPKEGNDNKVEYGVYKDDKMIYGPFDSVEVLKSTIPGIANKIK